MNNIMKKNNCKLISTTYFTFVVCPNRPDRGNTVLINGEKVRHRDANFMGTGMALVGVLKHNETLDQWLIRATVFN